MGLQAVSGTNTKSPIYWKCMVSKITLLLKVHAKCFDNIHTQWLCILRYSDQDKSWPIFLEKSESKSDKSYPGHFIL